jgi:hypothetical protein
MLVAYHRRILAWFDTFLHTMALASHWLEDFAAGTPMAERMTNVAPPILSGALAASQSTFVMG